MRAFQGQLERDWWISSYSGPRGPGQRPRQRGAGQPPASTTRWPPRLPSPCRKRRRPPLPSSPSPRGASRHPAPQPVRDHRLRAREGRVAGTAHRRPAGPGGFDEGWAPVLQQQVEAVLDTPLRPALGIRAAAGSGPERKQVELEFFLPMGGDGTGARPHSASSTPCRGTASCSVCHRAGDAQGLHRPGVRVAGALVSARLQIEPPWHEPRRLRPPGPGAGHGASIATICIPALFAGPASAARSCGCRDTISTGILAGSSISSCAACPRAFSMPGPAGNWCWAGRVV